MLERAGLEAAKAVFNKTYVEKDGPLTAAITAYLQAVGREPVGQISDEIADAVREAYRRKVAEYDRDFRDPAMSGEPWKTKYGTNLHSTSLGEQWAMSQALRSALVATPPAETVVETDWINYRPLAEGEIIQDGDECLTDSHLGWQPAANTVGSAAPDPSYTAHRMYRRPLAAKPAVKEDETVVEALRPFVTFADIAVEKLDDGWVWKNLSNDRIRDWFGPSDFGLLQHFAAALAQGESRNG